jgi:prevent-host-death family protein
MEVNIHHAKTNLSRLILRAEAGEEVVIARAGKPAVKLVPVNNAKPKKYKAGALRGLFPGKFDDPDPEIESMFYESQILTGVPDEELLTPRLESVTTGNKRKKAKRA